MRPTPEQILGARMDENDSGADTIRGYLVALLAAVWHKGEGFSGKRPFGKSCWESDLYIPLAKAGFITATFDEDGYLKDLPREERGRADEMIAEAIRSFAGGTDETG